MTLLSTYGGESAVDNINQKRGHEEAAKKETILSLKKEEVYK